MLSGERVRLEFDQTRKDRYGRTLAYLYLSDGRLVNREMVAQGFAHAYTKYPFRHLDDFVVAEREAREAGRGLWAPKGDDRHVALLSHQREAGAQHLQNVPAVDSEGTRLHRLHPHQEKGGAGATKRLKCDDW